MRASRLLSLLLLLQARRQATAAQLAEELEVSVRTVYRDLEALSVAGVPVYTVRGPGGGCRLVDGWQTRLTGLTGPEAEALFLTGLPGPAAELGLGGVLAAARLKLLTALPEPLREAAEAAGQRFHLDAASWFQSAPSHPHLPALAAATWAERRVDVTYERGDGKVVERELDPLGLVLKAGVWYLAAKEGDAPPRVYRVSRMLRVHETAEVATRPPDFDLGSFWETRRSEFESAKADYTVVLRASPDARRQLRLPPDATVGGDGDGWAVVRVDFEDVGHARDVLLRLGGAAEVLEPADLRNAVTATARAIVDLYGCGV